MRQVLLTNKGVTVARMPRPLADPGTVLIRVRYSMVSVGTELAGLRKEPSPSDTPISQVKAYSNLLGRYFAKAVNNPGLARDRLKLIARSKISKLIPPRPAKAQPDHPVGDLGWGKDSATEFDCNEKSLTLVTDGTDWAYQAHTAAMAVPESYSVAVDLKGEILSGAVSIGILDQGCSNWLGSKVVGAGILEDRIIFDPKGETEITLVISNADQGTSRIELNSIDVVMVPPDPTGLPHSETDDIGWNLGYSAAGEVIAVGDGVNDLAPGDLVACGGAGKANHADFVAVPRNLVCPVSDGCDLRAAATATIGTIALQGVRRADPKLGERVAVIGLGLLGQLTTQMLHAAGCRVIGFDLYETRVSRAREFHMDGGSSKAETFIRLVRDLTDGNGADRTIICAATKSDAVVNLAMEITRRKGTVVIVGDVGLNVERTHFYKKEIDLLMSSSYGPGRYDPKYEESGQDYPFAYVRWTMNRNMQAYMELVGAGRIDIDRLIDAVVPIDEAEALYDLLAQGGEQTPLGVLLEYPDDDQPQAQPTDATRVALKGHRKPQTGKVNYVLVGAGAFGTSVLVPLMEKRRDCYFLKGVVSRDSVRGGNFARTHRLEVLTSDLAEVVSDPDIHMLVIATRHHEHAEQTIAGLNAGKHVFVEKPLALTWDELDKVTAVYQSMENPPLLMVGFNRRFSPALVKLGDVLHDRQSPLIINYRLNGGFIPPDHWIQGEQGGGRNIGEACHMYDVFRSLAGAPLVKVEASAIGSKGAVYLKNDNFIATLTFEDGSIGNLVYTALGPKKGLPKERIEIFCDGEAYIVDDFKALIRASDGETLWQSETPDKGHAEELSQLADAIKNGGDAPIPFSEIVEATAAALRVEDQIHGRLRVIDE